MAAKSIPKELLDLKDYELQYLEYLKSKGYKKSHWKAQGPLQIA